MRRLILEEINSSAALWSLRLALVAVAITGFGLAFGRFRYTDLTSALAVVSFAMLLACFAIVSAVFACIHIWREGVNGAKITFFGVILSLALLVWPGFLAVKSFELPRLNDISTDIDLPPLFSPEPLYVAARGGFSPGTLAPLTRILQPRFYPQVQPLTLEVESFEVFDAAQKVVKGLGWKILDVAAPIPSRADGQIEATTSSFLMGIPYNIQIRIRPVGDITRVDTRSLSRFGAHDYGKNAELIQRFNKALQAEMDSR